MLILIEWILFFLWVDSDKLTVGNPTTWTVSCNAGNSIAKSAAAVVVVTAPPSLSSSLIPSCVDDDEDGFEFDFDFEDICWRCVRKSARSVVPEISNKAKSTSGPYVTTFAGKRRVLPCGRTRISIADLTTCAFVNNVISSITKAVPVLLIWGERCQGCNASHSTRATSTRQTPIPLLLFIIVVLLRAVLRLALLKPTQLVLLVIVTVASTIAIATVRRRSTDRRILNMGDDDDDDNNTGWCRQWKWREYEQRLKYFIRNIFWFVRAKIDFEFRDVSFESSHGSEKKKYKMAKINNERKFKSTTILVVE